MAPTSLPVLPECRWRAPSPEPDRYVCNSQWFVVPGGTITARACLVCPIANHLDQPPVKDPRKAARAAAPTPYQAPPRSIWRFLGQVVSYAQAVAKWKLAGSPVTPPAELAEREQACFTCPKWDRVQDGCRICGCGTEEGGSLKVKRSMATESCPLVPPRWGPASNAPPAEGARTPG